MALPRFCLRKPQAAMQASKAPAYCDLRRLQTRLFPKVFFFFFFDSLSSGFFPLSLQLRKEFESVGLAHECPGCPVSINVPSSSKPEVVLLDLMYFADEVYIYIYIPSSAVCLIYAS